MSRPLFSFKFAFFFSLSLAASYTVTSTPTFYSFRKLKLRSSAPKASAADLLALLGPPQQASAVNSQEARQLRSCFKFLVPFSPTTQTPNRRSLSDDRRSISKENELIWWPPAPVMELARLAVDSCGDTASIQRTLDPTVIPVPDIEGSKEDRCELTRTPYGRLFINEEINSYLEFLFEMIVARGPSVGLNVSLSRFDFFHGHVFLARDSGRLGILKMANDNASSSVTVAVPARTAVPPAEKPGKFCGLNFKGWQQRVFFWLTTLGLQKFTSEETPVPAEDMPDTEKFMIIEAWKQADFLCKGYILSALEDDLYNVYSAMTTSKELWNALEKKYKTEDACLKKFVVAKFLDYKMSDNRTVGSQVQELQLIFHDLIAEDMVVNEAFQVAAMIEKLPPSWNDFKNYLKHKRKEMKLEDLVIRLKIEEDNKTAAKKSRGNSAMIGVNIVEEAPTKDKKRKKSKGQKSENAKKKFRGNCYNCGKAGHRSTDCRAPKKDKDIGKSQANIVEKMEDVDNLCAMISECNLVGNPKEWFLDSGATRHVCSEKEAFATYTPAEFDEELFMGNTATTKIAGSGKVMLKMTSGKVLTLNNVLYVPTIRKNLVSAALLVKNGFKCVLVSDKAVISKNEMFIGKGYLTEGLFKLNVMVVDNMNKNSASV